MQKYTCDARAKDCRAFAVVSEAVPTTIGAAQSHIMRCKGAGEAAEAARDTINQIANPTMPNVGERYLGTVVKTTNFGAFVSLVPGTDGLLHITEIKKLVGGKRVNAVEDVLNVGDKVQVSIKEVDPRGKLSLTPVLDGDDAAGAPDAPAESAK